ncbi:MAG: PHP domain-containing protein [Parachlamydiaceae bacterium]|nr:PHP domain-containing protein [Parachlamydiaceae bacterium]
MIDFRADLHCHTTCSDGTLTPVEIVKLAHEKGLKGLSITDHDTVEAYKTAIPAALHNQIPLISGIEFSTMHHKTSIHLLGYSFSLKSTLIEDFCKKHIERRLQRNRQILALLAANGMPIAEEDIQGDHPHTIGRPHIALAMMKKGYINSIQEAFFKYIGEGKPCYAAGAYFTVEETIDIIHQANGLAIIAHPHLIENNGVLHELLSMKFDGIEGYYARFPKELQERWVKIGKKKNWIITGGSDFHGDIKPILALGSSWVNEETFKILHDHYKQNS